MIDVAYEILHSVGLEEEGEGFFAGRIGGYYVGMEYWEPRNQIGIFWGARALSEEAKHTLRDRLRAEEGLCIREDDVRFDRYSVCVMVSISSLLGDVLRRTADVIGQWAKDFNVKSGCFVCGNDDGSVTAGEIGNFRAMMCVKCRDKLHDTAARALREESIAKETEKRTSGHKRTVSRVKGITAAIVAGVLLGLPWMIIPNLFLPLAWISEIFLSAILVLAVYQSYRWAAGDLNVFGFATIMAVSILVLAVCITYSYGIAMTGGGAAATAGLGFTGPDAMMEDSQQIISRGIMVTNVLPAAIGVIAAGLWVVRKER